MSTVATSTDDAEPLANILFDYPGADIILRSQDSYHFRVPKTSIANYSPIFDKAVRRTLDSPSDSDANAEASLPVVQLPENGEILHCLFTFIFPVTPLVPSTPEEIIELLSVAQNYQTGSVLTRIRDRIALHHPLPTHLEPALRIYALAQKYRLRPEALQTARTILNYPMTIEDLDNMLDIMPGAYLYELWKYRESVLAILAPDLTEFRMSSARGTITGLRCSELSSSQIPSWLDGYIESIGETPNLFDSAEFNVVMARHIKGKANRPSCECASIPSQTIRDFWDALASVVHGSFEKAESALSLVPDLEDPPAQVNTTTSPSETIDVPDTNLIIRSSDLVDFRVHKSVLAMVSPVFKVLLSSPQPSDSGYVDRLPVVQFSQDSESLDTLVTMLYPVPTTIPKSYDKVLDLLAACQKYEMASVQSSIRAEVKLGEFPAPKGAEAFCAYAIASDKGLIPEMENAARQTLDHPMTFETLGEGLRLFKGSALRDLASFRKRCRDNLVTYLDTFLKIQPPGPSRIWVGCPGDNPTTIGVTFRRNVLPRWLYQILDQNRNALKVQNFTRPLDIHSRIRREYSTAIENHASCNFCLRVHIKYGSDLCAVLEERLAFALDKESVRPSTTPVTRGSSRKVVLAATH